MVSVGVRKSAAQLCLDLLAALPGHVREAIEQPGKPLVSRPTRFPHPRDSFDQRLPDLHGAETDLPHSPLQPCGRSSSAPRGLGPAVRPENQFILAREHGPSLRGRRRDCPSVDGRIYALLRHRFLQSRSLSPIVPFPHESLAGGRVGPPDRPPAERLCGDLLCLVPCDRSACYSKRFPIYLARSPD